MSIGVCDGVARGQQVHAEAQRCLRVTICGSAHLVSLLMRV